MNSGSVTLTHIAGTFLIQADGAFLNGAGLGDGEDRNVTVPKTFRDGRNEVPYVSAQAWKRWLRNTAVQEAGWPPSEPIAIGWNPKGNVSKIASELNPVDFPEDDLFGYMRAQEGQGRRRTETEADDDSESGDPETKEDTKVRAVMRASPFAASLLVSLRSTGWRGDDEGFVHLRKYDATALIAAELERFLALVSTTQSDKKKDLWKRLEAHDKVLAQKVKEAAATGDIEKVLSLLKDNVRDGKQLSFIEGVTSPLPYSTRFYNTHLQGIFCLNYARLGVFWNVGDRLELEEEKVKAFLRAGKIEDVTRQPPYDTVTQNGRAGRIYLLTNAGKARKERAGALLKALSVLRGGAKQAQFGTDVSPKALIMVGLNCGNPILNHIFRDGVAGPELKVEALKEVLADYADRVATPLVIGIRSGYLGNEQDVRRLGGFYKVIPSNGVSIGLDGPTQSRDHSGRSIEIIVTTPLSAASWIEACLP